MKPLLILALLVVGCDSLSDPRYRQFEIRAVIVSHSQDGGIWVGYDTETVVREVGTGRIYARPGTIGVVGDTAAFIVYPACQR